MKTKHFCLHARRFTIVALVGLILAWPAGAQTSGGDYVQQLNEQWAGVSIEDRAERVMIPALSAMDQPPASLNGPQSARLIVPARSGWASASAWAQAEPQQATLQALHTVTESPSTYLWAQPYGEVAEREAVQAGLYTDMGDPPLLAAADHRYLHALSDLADLVNIEATRLAEEGDALGGATLLVRWLRFSRMIADRRFFEEKMWAFEQMRASQERLRDLFYLFPEDVDEVEMRSIIRDLDEESLNIDRIRFPDGDRLAARQIIETVFQTGGGPEPTSFGPTLARLGASDRPLRLFDEAALWQRVAERHAGYFDTSDELQAVYDDWELRWGVGPHDVLRKLPTEYARMDTASFAVLEQVVGDLSPLFDQRFDLRLQLRGTALSLGVIGYKQWLGSWPDPIFAIRPTLIDEIPVDPYDPQGQAEFHYFVPIRDQNYGPREDPQPHTITVVSASDESATRELTPERIYQSLQQSGAELVPGAREISPRALERIARRLPEAPEQRDRQRLRENLAEGLGRGGQRVPQPMPEALKRLAQVDEVTDQNAQDVFIDAMVRLILSPEYREALMNLAGQETVTVEDLRRAVAGAIAKIIDVGGVSVAESQTLAGLDAPTFSVQLDESQFVMYSMGPDRRFGWAERVGPGGEDVLIWPPMLSLVREQLDSSGR